MSDTLLTFIFQLSCLLPLIAFACYFSEKVSFKYLVMAFSLMFIDFSIVMFARKIPTFHFEALHWNWVGKLASIVLSISVFAFIPQVHKECGLVWKQKPNSLKYIWMLLCFLGLAGIFVGSMNPKEAFSLETFSFQLLIPSFSEEFMLRGILFLLFSRTFVRTSLAALIVTAWFAITHSVAWATGSFQFDIITFIVVGLIGSILMALRWISGSLVSPIVGHSFYNICIQAMAVFR